MGRVGKMEELQNLAVFLISGGCDWINGETIAMDGAQALATGGNFYETARLDRRRLDPRARFDQGAERKGPRTEGMMFELNHWSGTFLPLDRLGGMSDWTDGDTS